MANVNEIAVWQAEEAILAAVAALAESRDNHENGHHIQRVCLYVVHLAELLAVQGRSAMVPAQYIELLRRAVPLHDIGKIAIPDRILLKEGRLDAMEFAIMQSHTTMGDHTLEQAQSGLGQSVHPFFAVAREIALSHHERWDGAGYPQGLSGDDIPLAARLMAVADVYDALINRRIYKPAIPHKEAITILAAGRGSQFDPDILDLFVARADDFLAIAQRKPDPFQKPS